VMFTAGCKTVKETEGLVETRLARDFLAFKVVESSKLVLPTRVKP